MEISKSNLFNLNFDIEYFYDVRFLTLITCVSKCGNCLYASRLIKTGNELFFCAFYNLNK